MFLVNLSPDAHGPKKPLIFSAVGYVLLGHEESGFVAVKVCSI